MLQNRKRKIANDDLTTLEVMDHCHFFDHDEENRGWWPGFVLEVRPDKTAVRGDFGFHDEWDEVSS